jgi:transposase
MQNEVNKNNYNGDNIYVGLDVHSKNWSVTIMSEHSIFKTFSQNPDCKQLRKYLDKNFPGATYYSAYEAGFCGFSVHRTLEQEGIHNIIVNPADVPTTDKDKKQKEDKRDSKKLAKGLRNGELEAIYIPDIEMEELRQLVRYRKTLVKEITRNKTRVKFILHFHGIKIPEEYTKSSKTWAARFTKWLYTIRLTTDYGTMALQGMIEHVEFLRNKLLYVTKSLKKISKESQISSKMKYIQSVSGVGFITSLTLVTELGTISRFKSLDKLCSFVGFIPSTSSSGEKDKVGNITYRRNKFLRSEIVECSWVAVRTDPSLHLAYNKLCQRMAPNKAIIRIAKKLLSRIRYVLINEKEYEIIM